MRVTHVIVQDQRYQQCREWVAQQLPDTSSWLPLCGDASFRRYFRFLHRNKSYIVMDAPSPQENIYGFVAIANALARIGWQVPQIIAADVRCGFAIISDLGDQLLLARLTATTVEDLYGQAWQPLLKLQVTEVACQDYLLPHYAAALYQAELDLFKDWYLARHLQIELSAADTQTWLNFSTQLIEMAIAQPQIFVHRDYHSRNLMCLPHRGIGILDFQDGLIGPITYDLLSLLRDCYIDWPEEQVKHWLQQYLQASQAQGFLRKVSFSEFYRWVDWLSLQRHLKCLGIFTRLNYRDQKPQYLQYLPRVLNYVRSVAERYPEFKDFLQLLRTNKT